MSTKQNENNLIDIYSGDPIVAEMIKEMLIDQGIAANLKNQIMGTIAPWQVASGGLDPVQIEVFAKDKEKALLLINEFNNSK